MSRSGRIPHPSSLSSEFCVGSRPARWAKVLAWSKGGAETEHLCKVLSRLLEGLPIKLTELFKFLFVRSVSADVKQWGTYANPQPQYASKQASQGVRIAPVDLQACPGRYALPSP